MRFETENAAVLITVAYLTFGGPERSCDNKRERRTEGGFLYLCQELKTAPPCTKATPVTVMLS
jgi:hypothetical protein